MNQTKRLLFSMRMGDKEAMIDLFRNYGNPMMASDMKVDALHQMFLREWEKTPEYKHLNEYVTEYEMKKELQTLDYVMRIYGIVPDDVYALYILAEK